ncbi:MAG: hypothetical protein WBM97_09185, partial [Sedimenticolaceae bacterium]
FGRTNTSYSIKVILPNCFADCLFNKISKLLILLALKNPGYDRYGDPALRAVAQASDRDDAVGDAPAIDQ